MSARVDVQKQVGIVGGNDGNNDRADDGAVVQWARGCENRIL